MKIRTLDPEPLHRMPYLVAAGGGRTELTELPFLHGVVEGLPRGIDALICTADLQGKVLEDNAPGRLLGEAVVDELVVMADLKLIPPLDRTAALLAGDFYAAPEVNKRGASGDVLPVWRAFAARLGWVLGIAGNHDTFGESTIPPELGECCWYIDGRVQAVEGLLVGGVSGVIGSSAKPLRRPPEQFARVVRQVLDAAPDILLLHETPAVPEKGRAGSADVRRAVERGAPDLLVSGHLHWLFPLVTLPQGGAVLNVDGRVVILTASRALS